MFYFFIFTALSVVCGKALFHSHLVISKTSFLYSLKVFIEIDTVPYGRRIIRINIIAIASKKVKDSGDEPDFKCSYYSGDNYII